MTYYYRYFSPDVMVKFKGRVKWHCDINYIAICIHLIQCNPGNNSNSKSSQLWQIQLFFFFFFKSVILATDSIRGQLNFTYLLEIKIALTEAQGYWLKHSTCQYLKDTVNTFKLLQKKSPFLQITLICCSLLLIQKYHKMKGIRKKLHCGR